MPSQTDTNQFGSKEVAYGLAPRERPRSFPVTLNFTTSNPIPLNFQEQSDQNILEWVQAVYADNSNNTSEFSLTDSITQQKLIWPAGSQGYLPFMCSGKPVFSAALDVSGEFTVPVQLLTFPIPAIMWSVSGNTGSIGTDFSANKPALAANLLATIPLNAKRKNVVVQNQSAETIQIEMLGTGNVISIALLAPNSGGANMQGGDFASQTHKGRVRIFSSNAASQVFAREE